MNLFSPSIASIEKWLATPSQAAPNEDLETLRTYLQAITESRPPTAALSRVIEALHARAQSTIEAIAPKLNTVRLPISTRTRSTVRTMEDVLDMLARISLDLVEAPDAQLVRGLSTPSDIALWRIIHAIGRNLTLANLTATPYSPGTWLNLHRAFMAARRHRVENRIPAGAQFSLQSLYARYMLLGVLPVSALSALEWSILHRLALRLPIDARISDSEPEAVGDTVIWVAPELDMPPVHLDRKAPPEGTLALFIRFSGLHDSVNQQIVALSDDAPRAPGMLPDDVSPRTARIALARVSEYIGTPRKRRFPRRRQGYRATLCFTLPDIIRLLRDRVDTEVEVSEWMIVNESPGGYAAMHVSGKPHKVQVGDLIGIQREGSTEWSVCIVRWALSENQEHIELGLQEVSPKVEVGTMATPGLGTTIGHPALLLPALPPLRDSEAIAFAPGNRPAENRKHVLVLDGGTARVREFRLGPAIEQSMDVEVALITPESEV
jgi:cyclic-di-GMP-binding protein